MPDKSLDTQLKEYTAMYDALKAVVSSLPEDALAVRTHPEKWSIQELVTHIVDSELHYAIWMMAVIAEDNPQFTSFDQEKWAEQLFYTERDTNHSLLLFGLLRGILHDILSRLPKSSWKRTGYHEEKGTMTLKALLSDCNDHAKNHLAQIIARKMEIEQ
jgi:hypothetical protein